MPRLGYKKSRGGCARCKQRRVKCDENRPCGACIRHNTQCSLVEGSSAGDPALSDNSMSWEPSRRQPASAVARAPSLQRRSSSRKGSGGSRKTVGSSISPVDQALTPPTLLDSHSTLNLPAADLISDHASSSGGPRRQSSVAASSPDPFPYFVKFSTGPVESVNIGKWITDLELMHHYATTTSLTMPRSSDASSIWQFEVPKLGLTYMFLMHQVLAISALHLGYLKPERRASYFLHASQHQNDAIAGMRESLVQITPDNCHALFAASSLLLISAFATFPNQVGVSEGHDGPNIDDVLDVFLLVRGMSNILSSSQPIIRSGPFRSFFTEVVTPQSTPLLDAVTQHLQNFSVSLETAGADPASKEVVATEIKVLLGWISHATDTTAFPELRVTLTWPIGLTEEYMQLLRNRDPAALTLLAFYSVAARATEPSTWFMEGWGINVARAIASHLDPAWKDMIRWPLAFISDRTVQI